MTIDRILASYPTHPTVYASRARVIGVRAAAAQMREAGFALHTALRMLAGRATK